MWVLGVKPEYSGRAAVSSIPGFFIYFIDLRKKNDVKFFMNYKLIAFCFDIITYSIWERPYYKFTFAFFSEGSQNGLCLFTQTFFQFIMDIMLSGFLKLGRRDGKPLF